MGVFKLKSSYRPQGTSPGPSNSWRKDKPGPEASDPSGVTGSGKTFTMANVIERVGRPTLVIAHNKTLAAQLAVNSGNFSRIMPEYFVSYYDYYQPEAYIPHTDTYIEKDASINDEIEKLRHSATSALFERRDVIIVASVSAIYGLGSPDKYRDQVVSCAPVWKTREEVIRQLVAIQYERNDINLKEAVSGYAEMCWKYIRLIIPKGQ